MPRMNDEYISDGGGGFRPVAVGYGTHFFDGKSIVEKPKKKQRMKLTKEQQKIAKELQEEERLEREREMWDAYIERDDREEYFE